MEGARQIDRLVLARSTRNLSYSTRESTRAIFPAAPLEHPFGAVRQYLHTRHSDQAAAVLEHRSRSTTDRDVTP